MTQSTTPSLSRAGSRSSLWRSWSPALEGLTNYEKSRQDYPWLVHDVIDDRRYNSSASSRPRPLSSLIEVPDAMSQSDLSVESVGDVEEQLVPEYVVESEDEDPNIVCNLLIFSTYLVPPRARLTYTR
jgi:hypothetical protein